MIVLKILSSKTKLDILKLLSKRNYTLTELSKHLNKSKSTISEHLDFLCNNGFVNKEKGNHKWIYYSISEKGKLFLEHINALKMAFGTGISVLGVFYVIYRYNEYMTSSLKSAKLEVVDKSYKVCNAGNVGNIGTNPNEHIANASNYLSIINHIGDLFIFIVSSIIVIYAIYYILIKRFGANRTI